MTRERIEEIREAVVPFVKIILGKVNLGNIGNTVAEEFEKDFNEITELAINGLEKEQCEDVASKKGKWIKQYTAFVNDDNQIVTKCHCSNCHGIAYFRSLGNKLVGANYCPVCGSFMESEVVNELDRDKINE